MVALAELRPTPGARYIQVIENPGKNDKIPTVTVNEYLGSDTPDRYTMRVRASTQPELVGSVSSHTGLTPFLNDADREVLKKVDGIEITVFDRKRKYAREEPKTVLRVEKHDPLGRRLYVHEGAFADLAAQSREGAELIYDTLLRVSTLKTAYSQIQEAMDFGLLPRDSSEKLLHFMGVDAKKRFTKMLKQIGYQPQDPTQYRDFLPLLGADEKIVGSCYDIDYFTFATGIQSSTDMFEEMGGLKPANDLTIVSRGKANRPPLAFIDPTKGTGEGKVREYFFRGKTRAAISEAEIEEIKNNARNRVLTDIAKILKDAHSWSSQNPDHQDFVNRLFSAYGRTLWGTSVFKRKDIEADDLVAIKTAVVERAKTIVFDRIPSGHHKKRGQTVFSII